MKNKPASSFIVKHKKFSVIIFLTLLTAVSVCLAIKSLSKQHPGGIEHTDSDTDIAHVKGDWWKTRRLIYHGIPARCVIRLSPKTDSSPDEVVAAIWREFDRIGAIFNPFDPDSEVFRLNSDPRSGWIKVSDDVYSVLSISKQLWLDTNGQFDPTMWKIKQLWQAAEKISKYRLKKILRRHCNGADLIRSG